MIAIIIIVLSSPKTPLVGERWDYQDQQVFNSLYCILSNAEITCSPDQKAVQDSVTVLQTIELKVLEECLVLKSWLAFIWSRVFNKPGKKDSCSRTVWKSIILLFFLIA